VFVTWFSALYCTAGEEKLDIWKNDFSQFMFDPPRPSWLAWQQSQITVHQLQQIAIYFLNEFITRPFYSCD
jgi:hypothetical protein